MKRILEFDENNRYIREDLKEDSYEIKPNEYEAGLDEFVSTSYILVGGQVVEGLSQAEIDALNNQPKEPTAEERLASLEDAFTAFMGV